MDENEKNKLPGQENPVRRLSLSDLPDWLRRDKVKTKEKASQYRVEMAAGAEACSNRKAAGKTETHFDGPPIGMELGGDDVAFFLKAPEGQVDGLLAVGAVFDGVSRGGHGDEAALLAARVMAGGLQREINNQGPGRNPDEIGRVAIELLAWAHEAVCAEKRQRGIGNFATTASIFALQETDGRKAYLHSWNVGDSSTLLHVRTNRGERLHQVTLPDDLIGLHKEGETVGDVELTAWSNDQVRARTPDPRQGLSLAEQEERYWEFRRRFEESGGNIGGTIENALGFDYNPRLGVRYQRVLLPKIGEKYGRGKEKGRVVVLKVTAVTDGVRNYVNKEELMEAFQAGGAEETNRQLVGLGKRADKDDSSAVTAEVKLG